MPFPRRASDGNAPGRPPVFTLRLRRQGISLRFLSLCRSDKSICDPPAGPGRCYSLARQMSPSHRMVGRVRPAARIASSASKIPVRIPT